MKLSLNINPLPYFGSGSTSSESFRFNGVVSGSTSQKLPMIKETYECRECGSSNIVKNGHSASGSQQYHCKDCGAHKVLDPEPRGYSEEEKEKILRAYRERGSKRAISRIFGISRNTLTRWLEKRDEKPIQ